MTYIPLVSSFHLRRMSISADVHWNPFPWHPSIICWSSSSTDTHLHWCHHFIFAGYPPLLVSLVPISAGIYPSSLGLHTDCDLTIHKIGNCLEKLEDTCQGNTKRSKKLPFNKKKDDKKKPNRESMYPSAPGSHLHLISSFYFLFFFFLFFSFSFFFFLKIRG